MRHLSETTFVRTAVQVSHYGFLVALKKANDLVVVLAIEILITTCLYYVSITAFAFVIAGLFVPNFRVTDFISFGSLACT